jgi:hypothetical protein
MLEQCYKMLDRAISEVSTRDISTCARLLEENINNIQQDSYSMNLPTVFTDGERVEQELEELVANCILLCACSLATVSTDRALLDSIK